MEANLIKSSRFLCTGFYWYVWWLIMNLGFRVLHTTAVEPSSPLVGTMHFFSVVSMTWSEARPLTPPPPPWWADHRIHQNVQFFTDQHVIPENLTLWEETHSWLVMFVWSSCFLPVSSWFCFCCSVILWVLQSKESQATLLVWRIDLKTLQKYRKVV